MLFLQTLTVLFVLKSVTSARILAIVPTPSYSHQIVFKPLWRELSLRGHQLTLLTTDPMNDDSLTNITEIDLSFSYKTLQNALLNLIDASQKNVFQFINTHLETFTAISEEQLSHPIVKSLIQNKSKHFDVLLAEVTNPAMFAFSRRFNCPVIGICSVDSPEELNIILGNSVDPILYSNLDIPNNTFFGRLKIFAINLGLNVIYAFFIPSINGQIVKHFGDKNLSILELMNDMALLLTNSNPIFSPAKPLLPNIIRIGGGIHIQPEKPLPKNLKIILDEANQGFIYFSLGSNANSKDLPKNTQKTILNTFAELPYKVLWKFEIEDLEDKPDNVIVAKWFPQQDILRHPNLKLFITQGGLQSVDEAIHFKIPILGMPVFADQPYNVKRIYEKGVGLRIDYKGMSKEAFKKAILEVVNNSKYRERMIELSNLVSDEPMSGLEKAVWWTEYVIRHKGAKHLRSPALDLPVYQYYLLDVIGFCVFVLIGSLYILALTVKKSCKLIKNLISTSKVKIE